MKAKFFIASLMLMFVAGVANAQGYKDGIEYYKVGQYDNAKELLERNLNSSSTDKAVSYYYLGQIALKSGNVAEAKSLFDQGVAANPNEALNYVGLGALDLKNGGKAKEDFDKARKLAKKNCGVEMEIARAYYAANPTAYSKDINKCINNARKWNADDPNSYIFEADMYADKQDWGNSAGIYEMAFTKDPNNIEAYVKYCNTYFNVNPSMAIERLEELNNKRPGSALVQRQLAEKYYEDNQGSKATDQYGKYIQNPNHFAQDEVRYVQLLFFNEKFQDSYNLATSLVNKLDPSDSKVFFMRRMQLYNLAAMEKWQDAAAAGNTLFSMTVPKGAAYTSRDYVDYATALQNVGRSDEAINFYNKAIELNPKNTDLVRNLGDSYADSKDYVKAAEYYQRLVDGGNNNSNDLYQLSKYYYNAANDDNVDGAAKANYIAKALQYANEVDKKVPGNVQIINHKARIAKFQEGDTNTGAALSAYRELVGVLDAKEDKSGYDNYYRYAYNYMATYYWNQGDKATAKNYYQLWLEHDPDNTALRQFVEGLK